MKRIFSAVLVVVMILASLSLVACASDEEAEICIHTYVDGVCTKCNAVDPNYVAGEEVTFTDPVTIKFYHTMGQNLSDVLDQYIVEFNKLFPNITISWEQIGNYDDVKDQISTEITAGNQPNMAYCYADHVASYNESGAVQTLDKYIDSKDYIMVNGEKYAIGLTQQEKDSFIEGYYAEGATFGSSKMYTLPFSKSTEVLYYNKTFFEQNGIQVPDHWFSSGAEDKTSMEYVMAQCKALNAESIPLGYDSEGNWFITMCEQYGSGYTALKGEHYLFNNQTNRDFVAKFRNWYQDGLMTTQGLYGSYTSGLFTSTTNQTSYMSIGSSAGATHQRPSAVEGQYPFEVGIAPIPQIDAANPKAISQGPSVCIFKKDNEKEVLASWLFLKYLTTSVAFQADFSMASGYIPVLKQEIMLTDETFKAFYDAADGGDQIAALAMKAALAQENAYYTSPAFKGSSAARTQVGTLMQACFALQGDGIEAQIADLFNKAIQECKNND